jgi:transcription antitermination factor NusG
MMPTLPPMPDRSPADVLGTLPCAPEAWWILRTRPRQEKKLARWLRRAEVPYFVPLRRRVRNWRGRRIRSEEPLLAGYVFVRGMEVQSTRSFSSGAVVERLRVENAPGLFAELKALDILCSLNRDLQELPGVVEGREVEILAGPMKGMRGVVTRSGAAFVVSLEILGRVLEVALDPAEVEPL